MFNKKDSTKSPRDTNGPVVKTGPTSGQNRSRNKDGEWRKKRSDAGESKKKSGCFLTTAACTHMGRPDDCVELATLRHFRDYYLSATPEGRTLVQDYYRMAPLILEKLDGATLDEVWDVIVSCTSYIEQGQFKMATCTYVDLVVSLLHRHGLTRYQDTAQNA
jgi:hypothetical protein